MAESVGPQSPSRPTFKRLFALSGNRCAMDGCKTRLVDVATGSIVGEVCHIRGEKPAAPRYDATQDNAARHGFENLILLCNVHHKIIDDSPSEYPVPRLMQMKESHETRLDDKETVTDSDSEAFTAKMINYFGDRNEVVQVQHVSGGQVAHTIINHAPPDDVEDIKLDGKTTLSAGLEPFGCPYLTLTVVCRSKRPAKIRRAVLSLLDQGIMAALEKGFGEKMSYEQLPGSEEELMVELFAGQERNAPQGIVLQRDDSARFFLPVLAAPVGLFLIRPEKAMSLKVTFFDDSEQTVVHGDVLKGQLEGLMQIARKMPCKANFPPVKIGVTVKSLTLPEVGPVGKVNPNPITFGLQVGCPVESDVATPPKAESPPLKWYERKGKTVPYPEILQGALPHCVYAAIAGAVNHLAAKEIWLPSDLFQKHREDVGGPANFGVANTALKPVQEIIEKHQHNKGQSSTTLSLNQIRDWVDSGAVVILSMELRNDEISRQGGWHMFSLVARDGDKFQVWDTNGLKGFLTGEEIMNGFYYPNGWFFMPHNQEDTLVLWRKS
jgi:hypothetical protein